MDSSSEGKNARQNAEALLALIDANQETGIKAHAEVAIADEFREEAIEYAKSYGTFSGLSLGYESLNRLTGSFLPGEVFVIAGVTSHGKSILVDNIAYRVYKKTGKGVLLITLENTHAQTLSRIIRIAQKETGQEAKDVDVAGIIFQDKETEVTPANIPILIQKAKELDVGLVIIDHLHFFARSRDPRTDISRLTKAFKEFAVKYEIPMISVSHVSRTMEKGELPDLKHLKESGSIEQDADMVGFVWRDVKAEDNLLRVYMRKNRSRKLIYDPIYFEQDGWDLTEA